MTRFALYSFVFSCDDDASLVVTTTVTLSPSVFVRGTTETHSCPVQSVILPPKPLLLCSSISSTISLTISCRGIQNPTFPAFSPDGMLLLLLPLSSSLPSLLSAAAAAAADNNDGNDDDNGNNNKSMPSGEKAGNVGFWIPRHEMVKLMVEEIEEHNKRGLGGRITLCTGQECVSVVPRTNTDGESVTVVVTTKDASSSQENTNEYNANLVIGADGMNSKVRQCLHYAPPGTWSSNCVKSTKFQPKTYTSPASYLRIKVLQLPPQFEIPDADGKPPLKTFSEDIYAIRSVNTGPRTFLSLGLLPMKDNDAVRPTNIITRPDHGIWKITNGKSMREYFQQAFPRFNFQEGGLISNQEWDRFAKAEGTRFPPCQYSPGLAVWDTSGRSGVALVGDSIHAFSPDIGQGVNAGLMDVVCLDRALSGLDDVESGGKEVGDAATDKTNKQTTTLEANLERYQKQHAPEIAALIRLARFGAPYQYKQPHRADRALRLVWTANVAMRLLLNKVSFGVIQPPCIILSQNEDLTFREVMRRADRTTALLKTIVLAGLTLWAKRRFGLALFRALP
mmetsp:Transcript_27508/g.40975  ORF Transcript_27508/g.40975 Transcript_27508/m.40975 type:complete len:564 (+) Transcript_27508:1180-2871(+)